MDWTDNDELNNTGGRSSTSSTTSNQENLMIGSLTGRKRGDGADIENSTISTISAIKSNLSTLTTNKNNVNNNNSPELLQNGQNDSLSDEELSDFSISFSDDEEFRLSGNNNGKCRPITDIYIIYLSEFLYIQI